MRVGAPVLVCIPKFKFFVIEGKGNLNDTFFPEYVAVLYALSYGVKMSPKKGIIPQGYYDYTVYPLEGVWETAPIEVPKRKIRPPVLSCI